MANTQLLRRRIKTAQNVSKTTRAMQMIAASKMKRAQDATLASRPYVEKLSQVSTTLSHRIGKDSSHPFLQTPKEINNTLLLVFAPDKGLCGGLITNLIREVFQKTQGDKNLIFLTVGKKIEHQIGRLGKEIVASFPFGTTLPSFNMVFPIGKIVEEYFLTKKVDSVQIVSTHFSSIFAQKPTLTTLLPVSFLKEKEEDLPSFTLFEPSIPEILPYLLKHYLEMSIYQHLLESFVSEQAARMIAMQNATDNAKEIISALTLSYNKARQSKITSEILDISSGSLNAYA